MTAGDDLKRVRVILAAIGETVEIQWCRRIPDPGDPGKYLTQTLIVRQTAPPPSVWDVKLQQQTEEPDPHD